MAFHIRDEATDAVVRELARVKGVGLTEAVRASATVEREREKAKTPLWERIRPILNEIAARPKSGLKADKAFFDDMWGQGED